MPPKGNNSKVATGERQKSLQNCTKEIKMWSLSSHPAWACLFSSTFQTMWYSEKKENANCGCELLLPPNFILLQLSKEQVFWDVSKTSASEELFLETKYNSSANLADRCGYFSDKAPWDLIILFSKRKKKNPLLSLSSSLQNILVCGLRKNGSFNIIFINGYWMDCDP